MTDIIDSIEYNYLYLISARAENMELCNMEMRYIFSKPMNEKYHFSNKLLDSSRSTFIKSRINILYKNKNIETLEKDMDKDNLSFNDYKIRYVKFDEVPYKIRLQSMRALGFCITGDFAIHNPQVEFVLTKIDGYWIFGREYANPNTWIKRIKKPYNYSHALDVKLARALVNIAIHNDFECKVIDPCCGIGTILIEGRVLGINIKGYEINPLVKQHCNSNLEYFGFEPNVPKFDMLTSKEHFDVAILDVPYGQFSLITKAQQISLIRKTKEISDKSVIITMEDMTKEINSVGLSIIDSCKIKKSNAFSRYVMVCE